ncbi:hypothetical protein T484DRAFT_2556803 [Baffinella frigidus]|nr:hypothetical protein T484DRAFT_2556803 [Cryptophyta sp. CCMP2293]
MGSSSSTPKQKSERRKSNAGMRQSVLTEEEEHNFNQQEAASPSPSHPSPGDAFRKRRASIERIENAQRHAASQAQVGTREVGTPSTPELRTKSSEAQLGAGAGEGRGGGILHGVRPFARLSEERRSSDPGMALPPQDQANPDEGQAASYSGVSASRGAMFMVNGSARRSSGVSEASAGSFSGPSWRRGSLEATSDEASAGRRGSMEKQGRSDAALLAHASQSPMGRRRSSTSESALLAGGAVASKRRSNKKEDVERENQSLRISVAQLMDANTQLRAQNAAQDADREWYVARHEQERNSVDDQVEQLSRQLAALLGIRQAQNLQEAIAIVSSPKNGGHLNSKQGGYLRAAFDALAPKSGLDAGGLAEATKRLGAPRLSHVEATEALRSLDRDKDERLTFLEFSRVSEVVPAARVPPEKLALFLESVSCSQPRRQAREQTPKPDGRS